MAPVRVTNEYIENWCFVIVYKGFVLYPLWMHDQISFDPKIPFIKDLTIHLKPGDGRSNLFEFYCFCICLYKEEILLL